MFQLMRDGTVYNMKMCVYRCTQYASTKTHRQLFAIPPGIQALSLSVPCKQVPTQGTIYQTCNPKIEEVHNSYKAPKIIYLFTRRRSANTAHTQMGRGNGLHTRHHPTLEGRHLDS